MYMYSPADSRNGLNHNMNGTDIFNRVVVDGNYVDGSWELSVFVEDLNDPVSVRVLGDLPLGGLMHRIVDKVRIQQSWSDYAIWWIDRNVWLLHSRRTLNQYGIQSDARLMFRRMHNPLKIVLPSLAPVVLTVNYASQVFSVVKVICKELNIRYSEELSLSLPITKNMLKSNYPQPTVRPSAKHLSIPLSNTRPEQLYKNSKTGGTNYPLAMDGGTMSNNHYATMNSVNSGTMMRFKSDNSLDQERLDFANYADCALKRSAKAVFADNWLMKTKSLVQKARLNSGWLDSSRSLLEQGIIPNSGDISTGSSKGSPPTLYLSFKYYTFYDMILKYDSVRIHQLYEQARWSILSGLFDCKEDEMVVLAAYQLQAELQSNAANQSIHGFTDSFNRSHSPYATIGGYNTINSSFLNRTLYRPQVSPDVSNNNKSLPSPGSSYFTGSLSRFPNLCSTPLSNQSMTVDGRYNSNKHEIVDEVDELLNELEQSCGVKEESDSVPVTTGTLKLNMHHGYDVIDVPEVPTLEDNLKVYREKTFLVKRYKSYWGLIRENRFYLFSSKTKTKDVLGDYLLRDCTVTPDLSVANQKFLIKLILLTGPAHKLLNGNGTLNGIGTTNNINGNGNFHSIREEVWLKMDSSEQYARWLAAFRLGSKGKTLASKVAYNKEINLITELIKLQSPGPVPVMTPKEALTYLGDLSDFCSDQVIRRARSKDSLRLRITEAHANIRDLSLIEAKYKYIQAWQRLNNFGRSYFLVDFERSAGGLLPFPSQNSGGLFSTQVDDIVAISSNHFEIISPQTGDVLQSWNFADLRSWNVNWDVGKVILEFRNTQLTFRPLCVNSKTILEFIGGYVFLNQRNLEKSQELNERLFHHLTGVTD